MPEKLHIVVSREPSALLETAAAGFLHRPAPPSDPFPSPAYLLALRQGGLRDDLFALAAGRGVEGWFDPPVCVFHELPAWLGSTDRRPLDDFERAALVAHVLREAGGTTFRDREGHFLGAVDQLFGELVAEDVDAEAYADAVNSLASREAFEHARDADLVRVYSSYMAQLHRLGRRDGRGALADAALAIRASAEQLAQRLGGRREIRILGLADLRGGWRPLLRALYDTAALDRVVLYVTEELPLPAGLQASVERLGKPEDAEPVAAHGVHLVAAPDIHSELATVAARVRTLIDAGVAPHRIAIVTREARPYTEVALRALDTAGVAGSARRRFGYREIPVVRALLAFLQAAAEGWTRHGLAELSRQPYFAADVDSRVVNFLGYRRRITGLDAWIAALEQLLAQARDAEVERDDDERPAPTLPAAWAERALDRFGRFAAVAREVEGQRSLREWLAWLAQWLERDPWRVTERIGTAPRERWDVVRLDMLGWDGLKAIVADWLAAERQWSSPDATLGVGEFVERLSAMLAADVAVWTEVQRGVQVLEALAASYRSFDHLFLVGMNVGRFPKRAPSSLLLGERDREALRGLGLPLDVTADWDARERNLFETLVAGASRGLKVSYVALDEVGGDAIASGFVDLLAAQRPVPTLRAPEPVIHATGPVAARAARAAMIERDRATGRLSAWNGLIEDPALRGWLADSYGEARVFSPTEIESFAKCPWSHFSARVLRLRLNEDPDPDIDPWVRGTVLHDALKRFYDAAVARKGGPVLLLPEDAEWALPLLRQSLATALEAAGTTLWLGHPTLREVKRAEMERMLVAFLDFEIEENRKSFNGRTNAGKMVRTAVAEHEVAFDEVALERDGMTLRFRGIVDRVEVGDDERAPGSWIAAVDYKTTIYSCPGAGLRSAWADGVVLQVPLYAAALALLRPEFSVARVEYRAIKQAERVHALNLVGVSKKGIAEDGDGAEKMDAALSAAVRHVRRMRRGEFPAAPAPSCHCPPFCHAWDICRVRGGPSTGRD